MQPLGPSDTWGHFLLLFASWEHLGVFFASFNQGSWRMGALRQEPGCTPPSRGFSESSDLLNKTHPMPPLA